MNESWIEIACDVPTESAELVSSFLARLSGNGVCMENLDVDTFSTLDIPESLRMTVKAYVKSEDDLADKIPGLEAYLKELSVARPDLYFAPPEVNSLHSEDWSNSWKAHFKPLRVGKRLLIVPTWEEVMPSPDDLLLRIDPGMAFGTGGHETTRLCLELLENIMNTDVESAAPSLLDLGTGSGILAIAAMLLGANRVLALDIDPDAIEVARENLAINGIDEKVECGTTPLESLKENFDIILANILAEELARLAPFLSSRLNTGGTLILSGILREKEEFVRSGFAFMPLEFVRTITAGDWVAMQYRKNSIL